MGLKHLDGKWLWLAMLAFCVTLPVKAQDPPVPKEIEQHVNSATEVFENMLKTDLPPEKRALLDRLLKDAHGFAVFPNVQKMGMGMSTIQGMGVLAYRHQDGEWSPPIPLIVQGTSVGPHFGSISYDTLLVIKTPQAMERILSGQQRLEGAEATGPLQQAVSPQRDIVSYSRSRGLSVGMSVDDIRVTLNQQAIAALYGRTVEPREILSGHKVELRRSPCAQTFVETANRQAGKAPNTTYWK